MAKNFRTPSPLTGEGWGEGDERSHLLPLSLALSREGRGDFNLVPGTPA